MKITKIYISIIVLLIVALIGSWVYFYVSRKDVLKNEPFEEILSPSPSFIMGNNLSCEIKLSSSKEKVGETLSLLDLETDSPKMLSGSGGTYPMTKLFESADTLVIGLVASGSGSTDMFVINKKTGIFARTESGNLAGVFAFASKGICK